MSTEIVLSTYLAFNHSIFCALYFFSGELQKSVIWGLMALIFGAIALYEFHDRKVKL